MKLKSLLVSACLIVATASPCFASWALPARPLSKQKAKQLGWEIRSKFDLVSMHGTNEISVELELNSERVLRVELEIREGEKCLVSAELKEDRSKPGRVVVSFATDRAHLDMATLWVWVDDGMKVPGGSIYRLRVKDFVEPGKVRPKAIKPDGDPKAEPGKTTNATTPKPIAGETK